MELRTYAEELNFTQNWIVDRHALIKPAEADQTLDGGAKSCCRRMRELMELSSAVRYFRRFCA
jgi:hypothetical protein